MRGRAPFPCFGKLVPKTNQCDGIEQDDSAGSSHGIGVSGTCSGNRTAFELETKPPALLVEVTPSPRNSKSENGYQIGGLQTIQKDSRQFLLCKRNRVCLRAAGGGYLPQIGFPHTVSG